jgi:hypothetical protein
MQKIEELIAALIHFSGDRERIIEFIGPGFPIAQENDNADK